jgi:hypothetical protein
MTQPKGYDGWTYSSTGRDKEYKLLVTRNDLGSWLLGKLRNMRR